MAARPKILQLLKSGKILAGAIFPNFVATWNWLVEAFDGFVGDGDLNPQNGLIVVDRTNPAKPVIRCKINKVAAAAGVDVSKCGRFAIDSITLDASSAYSVTLKDCYYRIGGKTYDLGLQTIRFVYGIIVLRVSATGSTPSAELVVYHSVSAMQNAETNIGYFFVPLFTIVDGVVTLDWRIGPDCAMSEF